MAGKSSTSTRTQRARRRGLRPHRPLASREERCSKQSKAAKLGRQNPLCARWHSPELLLNWLEAWASAVNCTLEEKQQSARVIHLSHAALGLDERPNMAKHNEVPDR